MFFVSLAYTYIYICFILKKKEEMKNMKRDNKARREMKRYLLYMYIYQNFFFLLPEKRKKRTKKKTTTEKEKAINSFRHIRNFLLFFSSDKILFGGKFLCLFLCLWRKFRGEASCSLFSLRENFLTRL